jgi:low affinity Fe/Cu permease
MSIANSFTRFAKWTAQTAGHPSTFGVAVALIVIWAVTGPLFKFSDSWQLVINTTTTIVTFLMVFLIQNTQNRDGAAVQLKLDELVRAIKGASNSVLALENMTEEELERLKTHYLELADQARAHMKNGSRKKGAATTRKEGVQAEIGSSAASGKAAQKASTA